MSVSVCLIPVVKMKTMVSVHPTCREKKQLIFGYLYIFIKVGQNSFSDISLLFFVKPISLLLSGLLFSFLRPTVVTINFFLLKGSHFDIPFAIIYCLIIYF